MNIKNNNGVNWSNGVNGSNGVNWSNGVNGSDGVNRSDGVNWSYGIFNCFGVDNWIFKANKPREYGIFKTNVNKERKDEVMREIKRLSNGWYPKFNNAFELYIKSGNDWSKVKASEICSTLIDYDKPYEAWKDMPKELLDYIKSLPEFDAHIFKEVTGIDVEKEQVEGMTIEEVCKALGKNIKIVK